MEEELENSQPEFINRLVLSSEKFAVFALIFLVFLFFTNVFEIGLAVINHPVETNFWELLGYSFLESLKFFFLWILPAYLIFVLFHTVIPRITRIIFIALIVIFFAFQLGLIYYYNTTLLMLGSDVFGYSIEEIKQTVGASGSINVTTIGLSILVLSILICCFSFIPKKIRFESRLVFLLPVISLLFIVTGEANVKAASFSTDFETNLVKNKSRHFYEAAYAYFDPDIYEVDIYSEAYLGSLVSAISEMNVFEYLDRENFPFFRKEIETDVLSPFLEQREQKPNIVIIMVEGLGRAFTNEGAYLGNFTPYLDSLSNQSLYWPNFLSNGGRTFAALPSIAASLPFTENGFMELGSRMPKHLSLFNILEANGYETSFYHGGNTDFDNMQSFLRLNGVEQIVQESNFDSSYKKMPASTGGFTWGYGDMELYRYYFENLQNTSSKPRLDIFLTISTHSPFLVNNHDSYLQKFENRMDELEFSDEKKKDYRNYKDQYATILYADEALKYFMEMYQRRPDYENTIFFITGDHRIPEIPMATKIDRYHVPLVIFSPMLKRSSMFEAVNSHFNVTPTILSYLENSYGLELPESNAFLGESLDTTRIFQNIHNIPLKQNKTTLIDYVKGNYHLNGDDLYEIGPNFSESPVEDEVKKEEMRYEFSQFIRYNDEITQGKQILPDSITGKYSR